MDLELFSTHPIMLYVGIISFAMFVLTGLEMLWHYFHRHMRDWKDTLVNMGIVSVEALLEKTIINGIGIGILFILGSFVSWQIPPNIFTWILAIVVADFTYYWMHRFEHERSFLWAIHSVHHSSESYNLTTGYRLSWFESLIEWVFLIPMILLGFSPFQAVISLLLVAIYQHWIHTELIGKLGFLDTIFNTPSNHRVHHGSNRVYLDKNYGGILILWDKLFGTYQKEEEPVIYGLTKQIETYNPLLVNTIEYRNIWSRMRQCRNAKDALRILFGRTGWVPSYFMEGTQFHEKK